MQVKPMAQICAIIQIWIMLISLMIEALNLQSADFLANSADTPELSPINELQPRCDLASWCF